MSSTRSRSFSRASSGLPFPFVICQVGLLTSLSLSSGPMKPRGGGKHDAHDHESMAFHADHFAIHRPRCRLSTMGWTCKQLVLGVVSNLRHVPEIVVVKPPPDLRVRARVGTRKGLLSTRTGTPIEPEYGPDKKRPNLRDAVEAAPNATPLRPTPWTPASHACAPTSPRMLFQHLGGRGPAPCA